MPQMNTVGTHATTVIHDRYSTEVVYQSTKVVVAGRPVYDTAGYIITLNTGGWKTPTTKTRMNQASSQFGFGYHVRQKDGQWYVDMPTGQTFDFFGDRIDFYIPSSTNSADGVKPREI